MAALSGQGSLVVPAAQGNYQNSKALTQIAHLARAHSFSYSFDYKLDILNSHTGVTTECTYHVTCKSENKYSLGCFHTERKEGEESSTVATKRGAQKINLGQLMNSSEKFLTAVKKRQLEKVKQMMRDGVDLDAQQSSENGEPAVLLAVKNDDLPMLKEILKAGANPNMPDYFGSTALRFAAKAGKTEMVGVLLEHKANPDLASYEDKKTALHYAVSQELKVMTEQLIKAKANVDAQDSEGRTALHIATQKENLELAQLLCQHEASNTLEDARGNRAIDYAVKKGVRAFVAAIKMPEQEGGLEHKNQDGDTLLHIAAHAGHDYIVKALLDRGVEPMMINNAKLSPWQLAVQQKHSKCLEHLQKAIKKMGDENNALAQDFLVL